MSLKINCDRCDAVIAEAIEGQLVSHAGGINIPINGKLLMLQPGDFTGTLTWFTGLPSDVYGVTNTKSIDLCTECTKVFRNFLTELSKDAFLHQVGEKE